MHRLIALALALSFLAFMALPAAAGSIIFNNDTPNNLMATASRPSGNGKIEIEAADDFLLTNPAQITSATFTGLLPAGASVNQVVVEIYRVFPLDSTIPPSGNVPTRANSPSDVAFATRDSNAAGLTFLTSTLSSSFTALNSVLNGINKVPNQRTLGEGPVTGQEVQFNVTFTTPFDLPADHYFFIPQVLLADARDEFYWLSASRPISGSGTTPFSPDLQSWIRNANLEPDWLRVGMDIVGGTPAPAFNASFSLTGEVVPLPPSVLLLGSGLLGLGGWRRFRKS